MKKIIQLTPYGKRVLIITSILSLGLIWVLYLSTYGFYELAYLSLKKKNKEVKESLSTFGIISLFFYCMLCIVLPVWVSYTQLFSEVDYNSNPNNEISALYGFSLLVVLILVILTFLVLLGVFLSAIALVQLGMKLIYYSEYRLSNSFYILIIFGTFLTLGMNWLMFLITFGIYDLIIKLYHKERTQKKKLTKFGIISLIAYTLFLFINITFSFELNTVKIKTLVNIFTVFSTVSLYGLLQVAMIKISKVNRNGSIT